MNYELMGHNMNTATNFCEDCGQPKGRIVARGLACKKVETEDREEPEERFEMESEN